MSTTLVLQVVCDRVIFFSADPDFVAPQADHTWIVEYDLPLPEGMTTMNCWRWRLTEGKLLDVPEVDPKTIGLSKDALALVRNKVTLRAELVKAKERVALKYLPADRVDRILRERKFISASNYLQGVSEPGDTEIITSLATALDITPNECAQKLIADHNVSSSGLWELTVQGTSILRRIETAKTAADLEKVRRQIADMT